MVLRKTIYYPFAWGICLNSSAWEQCVKGDYVQNRYAFMGSVPDAMQTQGSSCGENIPFSPLTCFSGSMGCFYSHRTYPDPSGEGTVSSLHTGGSLPCISQCLVQNWNRGKYSHSFGLTWWWLQERSFPGSQTSEHQLSSGCPREGEWS